MSEKNDAQRLAICSGWLLKLLLSTVTKRSSEDKALYLHFTQPLQIAAVGGRFFTLASQNRTQLIVPCRLLPLIYMSVSFLCQ